MGAPGTPDRPYRYRGDVAVADVAFEARAASLEALFTAAADATTNAMAEHLEAIEPRERREIRLAEESADLLLYRFLEELVYRKDAEGLLLRVPEVRIRRRDGLLELQAEARGEPLDARRHGPRVDVKAVTLHRLRVEQAADGRWEAFVVLDV